MEDFRCPLSSVLKDRPLAAASLRLRGLGRRVHQPRPTRKPSPRLPIVTPLTGAQDDTTSAATTSSAALPPRLLGVRDAALYLGVSPFTVRNMIRDGRLQNVSVPGLTRVLVDRLDLDSLIETWKKEFRIRHPKNGAS